MISKLHKSLAALALLTLGASPVLAGPIMHVDDAAGNLGTVDVATGAVSVIGNMGVVMTDIAFNPVGALFGVSFTSLYSINPTTAASSLIGPLGLSGANALVFAPNGTLYSAAVNNTHLFTVNTATGAATDLGQIGTGFGSAGDLAFNGGNFFMASTSNHLIRIDLSNLAASVDVGAFGVGGVFGLATGDNGVLYAVAGTDIYTVNTTTGAASNGVSFGGQGLLTAFGESFFTEAGAPNPVPEPASLAIFGIGLLGLRLLRRKSAKRAA